ncbi:MAG: MBL fold metallo-hydrolase [Erysipelotrichaceae bacterium]|nr:MBL fold metallo-hydrolase [Erysipelotrichaceae bacterium]MBR6232854.1 MBL fold metallo-hydrolase [Erysipelotrichaceae bacterium]
MMDIRTYVMGPIATNTYVLVSGNEAIIIDPASKPEKMIEKLGDLDLKAVLLTHGHFDHIKACDGLYEKYHCPIYLHEDDEELARDKYSGADFGLVSYISCKTLPLKEGKMKIGPFEFEVIFTPGHTPGSVIFVFDHYIFTGDTLFRGSVGRTDLKGGDARTLKESLRVFKSFKEEYFILPGHDDPSTLSFELANNWYLR